MILPLQWSFPVFLFTANISMALAAGCTCIMKPAKQTPLTALHMAALFKEVNTYARAKFVMVNSVLLLNMKKNAKNSIGLGEKL